MSHRIVHVFSFERVGSNATRIRFDGASAGPIDVEPALAGEVDAPFSGGSR